MKIVIVYNTAWYILNFRRNLIRQLQASGAEIHAICPPDQYVSQLLSLGIVCHPWDLKPHNINPFKEAKAFIQLFGILRKVRPDAVLSFTIKCNIYTGLVRLFYRYKMIANVSGLGRVFDSPGLILKSVKLLYLLAFRKTDHVFFQNKEDFQTFLSLNLVKKNRAAVLPGSGIDISVFRPAVANIESNAEAFRSNRPRTFLMFGRLVVKKGYDDFIAAARVIKESGAINAEFFILGAVDGASAESSDLLKRIDTADKEGVIKYLGHTDKVLPILQAVDVVVLPSMYNEGVPRSLLEALACGRPIITTDWKGCRETVHEKSNGFLVPAGDVERLKNAMIELGSISIERLREMGACSRELAERKFDEKYVIERYQEAVGLPA